MGEGSFLLMCGRLDSRVTLEIWWAGKIAAFVCLLLLGWFLLVAVVGCCRGKFGENILVTMIVVWGKMCPCHQNFNLFRKLKENHNLDLNT